MKWRSPVRPGKAAGIAWVDTQKSWRQGPVPGAISVTGCRPPPAFDQAALPTVAAAVILWPSPIIGGGTTMHLHSCEGSRGLRCTWTAAEAGVDLPLTMWPFPPRARDKRYFAVNPLGTVPALVLDNGMTMTESSAIAFYLAQRFSPTSLALSPDEADYPLFVDFLHHADATLTFPQTVRMRFCLFDTSGAMAAAGEAYGEWFGKRLAKVEARLADRDYLCADRFTVADICIAYALWLTHTSQLTHLLSPRLTTWLATMTARPGFAEAQAREAAALAAYRPPAVPS